jgi:ATP-binding protein involved in chromosome partitioning
MPLGPPLRAPYKRRQLPKHQGFAVVTENDVLAALRGVKALDGKPLPESGMIAGLSIRDDKVALSLGIEPSQAKAAEAVRKAAEMAILMVKGVKASTVALTAERAQGAPSAQGQRPQARPAGPQVVAGVKHIIAVASGKGGVGKSTTSVNLALGLAAEGWKVGILDADVFGPSVPRLLGISGKPDSEGRTIIPLEAYGLKAMSMGFLVEERTAMVWRGPMVMSALQQMLRDVAWGDLDCLVIDMPPGTGDAQLTIAQSAPLAGAIIVSTPQDLALIDARRGISMFEKTEVPVLGVIENMSYFLCPHCGGRSDIFGHGGARKEAETLGVPFLGEAPLDIAIRETSDAGKPIVATRPDSSHAKVYREIARAVKARLETGTQRAAPKITIG